MNLSKNAKILLKRRYLLPGESFEDLFKRVANHVSKGDRKLAREFYDIMTRLEFLPNSPCLMNAGTRMGQLFACFVLPIEDSLESIYETLKKSAIIYQSGGGVGYNFSKIRPKGDIVKSTNGVASGPVSFIKLFNYSTDVVKQGGRRRGANMGILNVNHPDIFEFIDSKRVEGELSNFNISVGIDDNFMKALEEDKKIELINPRDEKVVKKVRALEIFDRIAKNIYLNGEPGLIFLDRLGKGVEATNPCGEVPLEPYEACVLGSINISKFVNRGKIDYNRLKEAIRLGVKFLNNILDINNYPFKEIRKKCLKNRKIGLGIMGFADALIEMKIRYNSEEALKFIDEFMSFFSKEVHSHSQNNKKMISIAPTGSISIIADCSPSIEPIFSKEYSRKIAEGDTLVKRYKDSPYLVTSEEVSGEDQIKIVARFQNYVDNSISKTVNLPESTTVEEIKRLIVLAYNSGLKGITMYRNKSRKEQVICKSCEVK